MLGMVWRSRCRSKHLVTTPNRFIKLQSFALSHNLSVAFDKPLDFLSQKQTQQLEGNSRTVLTPQIVQSTLLNCSSDLIALRFFLWCARQPNYFHDRSSFSYMVNVVGRLTDHLKTVKGIIKHLESVGYVTKPQTFLLLLRIYWHGRTYNMVFEAFEEMLHRGYTPNTYTRNIVMDVLFKIGRIEVALRVLKENQAPNFLTFSIAVCNLCRLNDLTNVIDILKDMLNKGYYLNSDTFLVVLNCFCKSGRLAEAFQLLGLMITLGIPTSLNVWSMLIDGFCKSRSIDLAFNLLEKMVDIGLSPNIVTCTSLIKGFMESKMPCRAFAILSSLESKGCSPDLVLCNVLIDRLSKMGRYEDALDVFSSLPQRKLTPDAYTFCSIMSAICMSRKFVLLPTLISGFAIEADLVVCNSLLNYFCRSGYPSGAVEFFDDMINRKFTPDKYSYAGLLRGLCGAGRIGEAVNVYHGIIANHPDIDPHIHTAIVHGLIKSGKFHKAIVLFRKAVAKKYQLDVASYTIAINGLLRGRRAAEAYTLYKEMIEIGLVPNVHTYKVMLSGLCRERDFKMFKQILHEMIESRVEFNDDIFNLLKNLLFKSRYSSSVYTICIQLYDSGLMPKKFMDSLSN